MNVDTETLHRIRQHRVETDPLVPHPRRERWLESTPGHFQEFVIDARHARVEEAPETHPIPKATWPETVIFCFTRSMDASIDQAAHLGAYQYAFDNVAQDHMGKTFDALTNGSIEVEVTERHRELAEEFRDRIAAVQHTAFLETEYDSLPFDTSGVPKAFWKTVTPEPGADSDTGSEDTDPQVTLTDY